MASRFPNRDGVVKVDWEDFVKLANRTGLRQPVGAVWLGMHQMHRWAGSQSRTLR